jgi:hypothetical protein
MKHQIITLIIIRKKNTKSIPNSGSGSGSPSKVIYDRTPTVTTLGAFEEPRKNTLPIFISGAAERKEKAQIYQRRI